jgi:hypothetical protein
MASGHVNISGGNDIEPIQKLSLHIPVGVLHLMNIVLLRI